ncbi:helix-turn-helix domain-containing protein [Burkholderia vietnamiensis]|uniref:helix-turn-helix domain-containing protein n=1 Tax=Burkholderia vietnamiensis TaxID=60552 RepID=UPI001CF1CEEC|nr:helix-turn-helix domain-containing protein [Burkholderia vietnamiensis]MCA8180690.1 helix-turn-helix domain-containing protein [Burkholderia vietnamiensis]
MFSGELDYRGLSDALGLPANEVNHRLYGGREPLLVGAGGTMSETASLSKRNPPTKHRHPFLARYRPAPAGDDELLTQAQVAHELGFTPASVCNLVKKGRLATVARGGRRFILRATLEAFRAVRFPANRQEVMTVKQAMRELGLASEHSVYRLLRQNGIKPTKFGGKIYLSRAELDTVRRARRGKGLVRSTQPEASIAPAPADTSAPTIEPMAPEPIVAPTVQTRTPAQAPTVEAQAPALDLAPVAHPERPVYAGPNRPRKKGESYVQAARTVPDPVSPTGFAVRRGTPVCRDDLSDLHVLVFKKSRGALADRLRFAPLETIDERAPNGETPLHHAARRGHLHGAALLLAHGADVHAVDEFGLTPLHHAAEQGHRDVVLQLIAFGARPDRKSYDGQTVSDLAKDAGTRDVLKAARALG